MTGREMRELKAWLRARNSDLLKKRLAGAGESAPANI
jgi:hypothetical protein